MSSIQSEAPPDAFGIETGHPALDFPHEEVRKANKLHKVFTLRDEVELCSEFHEGVTRGEDREELRTQIAAYINYMEATCNHAHFATDFLRNMVRDRVLQPEAVNLDDIEDDFEDDNDGPISCTHLHPQATAPTTSTVGDGVEEQTSLALPK